MSFLSLGMTLRGLTIRCAKDLAIIARRKERLKLHIQKWVVTMTPYSPCWLIFDVLKYFRKGTQGQNLKQVTWSSCSNCLAHPGILKILASQNFFSSGKVRTVPSQVKMSKSFDSFSGTISSNCVPNNFPIPEELVHICGLSQLFPACIRFPPQARLSNLPNPVLHNLCRSHSLLLQFHLCLVFQTHLFPA